MNQDDLKEALRLHSLWLDNKPGGKRANLWGAHLRHADLSDANLSGANLSGVNLSNANLWGVLGNGREVRSLQCGTYDIAYTADALQIGFWRHPIDQWWEFSDDAIDAMDRGSALAWWRVWKPILKQIIAAAPAKPHGGMKEDKGDGQ